MQDLDPPVQIDPGIQATLEAARIQADAAIRAAEIGAQGAWDAAMLQLWTGMAGVLAAFVAAVIAFKAGRWAYRAAINAAETQVQLENEKHNARVSAYGIKQSIIIKNLMEFVKDDLRMFDDISHEERGNYIEQFTLIIRIHKQPNDWKEEEWENLALLGKNFLVALEEVKKKLRYLTYTKNIMIETSESKKNSDNEYFFREKLEYREFLNEHLNPETETYDFNGIADKLINYEKALNAFNDALLNLHKEIPEGGRLVVS